jgi:hypothetical protein
MLELQLSFAAPCCAALFQNLLVHSTFTSSDVEIPLVCAGPNDERASSFDPIAVSSVPVIHSSQFPSTLSISAPLASSSQFSAVLYSHAEHPVSEYVVSCEKHLSISSRVLFLHTISLIHRHLVNLKASNHHFIQDSTWYLFINSL